MKLFSCCHLSDRKAEQLWKDITDVCIYLRVTSWTRVRVPIHVVTKLNSYHILCCACVCFLLFFSHWGKQKKIKGVSPHFSREITLLWFWAGVRIRFPLSSAFLPFLSLLGSRLYWSLVSFLKIWASTLYIFMHSVCLSRKDGSCPLLLWNFPFSLIKTVGFFLKIACLFSGCAGSSLLCGLFSSCGERGCSAVAVCRLFAAVAYLVEHRLWSTWASVVRACELSSGSCWALEHRLSSCGTRA